MKSSPAPPARGCGLPLRRLALLAALALLLVPALRLGQAAGATGADSAAAQSAAFTLDDVAVTVRTPFLPTAPFSTAAPGDASQVARAVARQPYRELAVIAVPAGTRPGTEALPVAQAGDADAYRAVLRADRAAQGGRPAPGPTARLFGQVVAGSVSRVLVHLDGPEMKQALIAEWVVAAGPRLWIVRAGQEVPPGLPDPAAVAAFLTALGTLDLESSTLDRPTTLAHAGGAPSGAGAIGRRPPTVPGDLPAPLWWGGNDCDAAHYAAGSGGIAAYRLGAVSQGLPACGPRPLADQGPDVLVFFFAGAWGEYEWECTELAFRYLYLAYDVAPYSANGSQVVWNYPGHLLQQVANGTPGRAPGPGDVLSYGPLDTFGHTSVVTAASVDANGDGTVDVIEEDSAATGARTLTVQGWWVGGGGSAVTGWLTAAVAGGTPTPAPASSATPAATPAATGTVTPTPGRPTATGTPPAGTGTPDPGSPTATGTSPAATATATGTPATATATATGTPPTATPGTPTYCSAVFADVPPQQAFYGPITRLACAGIISGYRCGGPGEPCDGQRTPYFRPGADVTRGQLLKMVVNAAGWPLGTPPAPTFADVPPTHPFASYIETGAAHAVISGYACGGADEPCDGAHRPYFRPAAGISRGQLSKVIALARGYVLPAPPLSPFADVPGAHPFAGFIAALAAHGIVSGYTCGAPGEPCDASRRPYFRPSATATRGQLAKFLATAFNP